MNCDVRVSKEDDSVVAYGGLWTAQKKTEGKKVSGRRSS